MNPRTGKPVAAVTPDVGGQLAHRSKRTIFQYLHDGKLTRYRSGGRVFVDANEVDLVFGLAADPRGGDAA